MNKWKHKIIIKDLLTNESVSNEKLIEIRDKVIRRLENFQNTFNDDSDISYYLEKVIDEFSDVINEEDFKYALDNFYDICDEYRIWVN